LASIEAGDLPPGAALPSERSLCDTFGVSRVSVREALAGLEAVGLIAVKHGKGAFVRESPRGQYAAPFARYVELYKDELIELIKVRGALDELAVTEACSASPENLALITVAYEAFREGAISQPENFDLLASLDVNFHLVIAKVSGSDLLYDLLTDLHGLLAESRRMTLAQRGRVDASMYQHQEITAAIVTRDAKRARELVGHHVSDTRELIANLHAL